MFCSSFSPIILIFFVGIVVAIDIDAVDAADPNEFQNLTRQCRFYEIEECLLQTWSFRNCEFENGTGLFGYSSDNKVAESWTSFSLKFLKDYYTPESVGDDIYLQLNDTGYISTNTVDFNKDAENFGRYCFIQETVKCFQDKSCDIQNHSENLGNLYSTSKNVPKMLYHIVKQFIKEKYGQVKNYFAKNIF